MARKKRGQNRKQQQHRKKNNNNNKARSDLVDIMDGRKFEEDYFTTTTPVVVESASHDQYAFGQFPDTKRKTNFSLSYKSYYNEGINSISDNIKQSFRPKLQNNSIINKPQSSSIAELVMKGEIDHSLARVTTARPTIIIYPTGIFIIIIC